MNVFTASVDQQIHPKAYTSLKALCNDIGISYRKAQAGQRTFVNDQGAVTIIGQVEIVKIKRGKFQHGIASNIPDRL